MLSNRYFKLIQCVSLTVTTTTHQTKLFFQNRRFNERKCFHIALPIILITENALPKYKSNNCAQKRMFVINFVCHQFVYPQSTPPFGKREKFIEVNEEIGRNWRQRRFSRMNNTPVHQWDEKCCPTASCICFQEALNQ